MSGTEEPRRSEEWQSLYKKLDACLSQLGTSSAVGKGDYWIVDDDWGGRSHKVCVFSIEFLTREMTRKVQDILREFPDWSVLFQIEILQASESIPTDGIVVTLNDIEEHWNREKLAEVFGKSFVWQLWQ